MRIVGVLLLIVAGVLAWLTIGDRMSPLALSVVEMESKVGFPLASIAALAGIISLVLGFRYRMQASPSTASPSPHRTPTAASVPQKITPTSNQDWVVAVIQTARALSLADGVRIKFDEGSGIPFTLHMERVTPEIERRSMDVFSSFLISIPTPPRAKVVFIGANSTGVPRQHAVKGSLRRVFHTTAYQVVPQQNWVDVLFFTPDPCWADRPFLFLDR